MLGGFSDSSLGSWSFWLQCLGIAAAIGVIISLLGMHLISAEISARAGKMPTLAASVSGEQMVSTPAQAETVVVPAPSPAPAQAEAPEKPQPKVNISLAKPVTREITEEQRTAFINELSDAPKHALPVVVFDKDPEIQSYADQIRVMLVLAGYDCGPAVKTDLASSVSPVGLMIVVKDPARAPSFAGAIQNAFKAIGITALGAKDEDFGVDQVAVVVGRKKTD
jgi:hypothetical protein